MNITTYIKLLTLSTCYVCYINAFCQTTDTTRYQHSNRLTLIKERVNFMSPYIDRNYNGWDFRELQLKDNAYNVTYSLTDSSDLSQYCISEHRTKYYFKLSGDTTLCTGYENATTLIKYEIPEIIGLSTFAVGDTLYGEYKGCGQFSHQWPMSISGHTTIIADSIGELLLPDIQIPKALRTHSLKQHIEAGLDSTKIFTETYKWFAPFCNIPLFETISIYTYNNDNYPTTSFQTSFFYHTDSIDNLATQYLNAHTNQQVTDLDSIFTEASYLPNPVISDLVISYKLSRDALLWFSLHNSVGLPMYVSPQIMQTQGYNTHSISMSSMPQGAYTLFVHIDNKIIQQVIIKQ